MSWEVRYLPEAVKDMKSLAGNQQLLVKKAIDKVSQNPLPVDEGGYGRPLGHKGSTNLTNYLKIKLRGAGIRIVYRLERTEHGMLIIIIGVREDDEVYIDAQKRIEKHKIK